jgi:asparagine synthase (glutamine-hydrolysing)
MCGICGYFHLQLAPEPNPDCLGRMSERLVHRGPDSHGIFRLPYLGMAIRRLSIIDLQTGDQPLSNETGEVTLVFNGEIYNYPSLRAQLLEHGHHFHTHSDGEAIAHLYEEKGPGFVHDLNGMFAVALWDARARRLVLARDRVGEKPLYYWLSNHTLVFASEIKALLEYPGVSREIDRQALERYFFYGYFPHPSTIYKDIKKLPGAHRLICEGGEVRIGPYWQLRSFLRPPDAAPLAPGRQEEILEELRHHLREAASSRLLSDVPLGVFLSGGIDSSTVVATMSELSPGNVKTFSVSFRDRSFNEENYAAQVARHFRTQHHVLAADKAGMEEALRFLAGHLDEPLGDPAVIPTYMLSKFARAEIKVALSGEGSDELFGGYPTYLGAKLAKYYLRLPRLVRAGLRGARHLLPVTSSAVPMGLFLRRFLAHAELDPAQRHQIWFGMFSPPELDQLFSPECAEAKPPSHEVFGPLPGILEGARFEDVISEMLYLDFCMYLEDNLLVKVDRASMACSLELRTPFLDHRLIEFAAGLPASLKIRGFELKHVMKKAVEPWLPHNIVHRQKRGFSVPIASWMRSELRPLVDETLGQEKLRRQGILNAPFVRGLLRAHWEGKADYRKPLWALLCFQLWHDHWA